MDNLLKWVLFDIVSGQITSDGLWKSGEVFFLENFDHKQRGLLTRIPWLTSLAPSLVVKLSCGQVMTKCCMDDGKLRPPKYRQGGNWCTTYSQNLHSSQKVLWGKFASKWPNKLPVSKCTTSSKEASMWTMRKQESDACYLSSVFVSFLQFVCCWFKNHAVELDYFNALLEHNAFENLCGARNYRSI